MTRSGRGSRLAEMLERSALDAELDRGTLTVRDPAGKPLIGVAVQKGSVVAPPAQTIARSASTHWRLVVEAMATRSSSSTPRLMSPAAHSWTMSWVWRHVRVVSSAPPSLK